MNKLDFLKLSKEQVKLNPLDGPAKYLNTLRKSNNANEKTIAGNQDPVTSTQDKPKLSTKILGTLKNIAKDPSTYSKLASVASVVAAAEGENTAADALSNISSRIDQNVRSRDTAKATVEAERIAAEAEAEKERLDRLAQEPKIKADIKLKKAQEKKLDLETDLLRNPEDPEAKRNREIYDTAYKSYITKINDPKEISFRKRLQEADKVLTDLTKTSNFGFGFGKRSAPRWTKRREFRQAQDNFINAQLRRASGAKIDPDEFLAAIGMYLPAIGDSAGVLEQKRKTRALLYAIPEFIDPTKIIKNQEQKQEQSQESINKKDYSQMSNKDIMEGL